MLRFKRLTLGFGCALLGAIGGLVPVFPGWPFGVFAVFLLSRDLAPVRPLRNWFERRYPRLKARVFRWECQLGLLTPEEKARGQAEAAATAGQADPSADSARAP